MNFNISKSYKIKNGDKTISDDEARKILELIHRKKNYMHPTKYLIEKTLKELGKTKASKDEFLMKLKEIVRRDGMSLIDDEIAWQEIENLSEG